MAWFWKEVEIDYSQLPPMENEPNQAEIDAAQAALLRGETYANVLKIIQAGKEQTDVNQKPK